MGGILGAGDPRIFVIGLTDHCQHGFQKGMDFFTCLTAYRARTPRLSGRATGTTDHFLPESVPSAAISLSSLAGRTYFTVGTGPAKVPRRSSLLSRMDRSTKTPSSTVMSSPRPREPASSAMPLGCVLSLRTAPGSACTWPLPYPPPRGSRRVLLLSFLSAQVGGAFQERAARQELDTIGSAPSRDHVFKVNNFAALGSIQKQLQEKIFAVEGKWRRS